MEVSWGGWSMAMLVYRDVLVLGTGTINTTSSPATELMPRKNTKKKKIKKIL